MKKAEYPGNGGCPQRDSAEHEEYAGARSADRRETEEADGADLLERILDRDNLNRVYKRVKANKGAPGVDGMTVEDALPWLREHREELLDQIRNGKYKPQPVRRKEIPKPDGGIRKLGIPTVVDRIIQQAIAQQLTPIYEPLFSDGSYGYRPGRSAQMAIQKVKEYAEQGYTTAVLIDLSKYKDLKALMTDLKAVYAAVDEQAALAALDTFAERWDKKYPKISQSWRENWPNLSTYFKYPQEVRRLIYTTNTIEGFNRQLRKVTKAKSVFPTDDSLFKMLYLAMMDITRKWTGRRQDWSVIYAQLVVFFGDRIPE
ncbi:MAG: transposase [Oscillospiraceae bacterium]|nr:transposase [Oscillospiraceae bacterium]